MWVLKKVGSPTNLIFQQYAENVGVVHSQQKGFFRLWDG